MHTDLISEHMKLACYLLFFLNLFLVVQMTQGFTGMRMSIMCFDLIIMKVGFVVITTTTSTLGVRQ